MSSDVILNKLYIFFKFYLESGDIFFYFIDLNEIKYKNIFWSV